MTKNQIIEQLFTGKNFNDCIGKINPAGLRDDLKMEVISRICELEETKVTLLHEKGQLEFYTVRIILNEIKNKYSGFSKKFIVPFDEYKETPAQRKKKKLEHFVTIDDHDERLIREELEDYAISEIENLYWYDKEMILLYLRHGTFRKIQEHTKIPYISCYKNIQKSLEVLRKKALGGDNKPLFTKEETNFIQNQ